MEHWENQLKEYMISKSKAHDTLRWVTYHNNILHDTLQRISDSVENFDRFTVGQKTVKTQQNKTIYN